MSVYLWARYLSKTQNHRSTCLYLYSELTGQNETHHSFTPPEKQLLLVSLSPKEREILPCL